MSVDQDTHVASIVKYQRRVRLSKTLFKEKRHQRRRTVTVSLSKMASTIAENTDFPAVRHQRSSVENCDFTLKTEIKVPIFKSMESVTDKT